jgi:hypothetical protein
MSDSQKLSPPSKGGADALHAVGRAVLSAVPVAGGAAVEIFNALVTPPIDRRTQEWRATVGAAIELLQNKDAAIVERLQSDEAFQSVLFQATWAAVRNHQRQKLEALRNAVINSAKGTKLAEDLQLLFVRLVDEMTPTHLVVLSSFIDHESEIANAESLEELFALYSANAREGCDRMFFKLIFEDLKSRNLVRVSEYVEDFPGVYYDEKVTVGKDSKDPRVAVSQMARDFILFVTASSTGDPT